MSRRTLVELNHDFCPPMDVDALIEWGQAIRLYMTSGDPSLLPDGTKFLESRHHQDNYSDLTIERIKNAGKKI